MEMEKDQEDENTSIQDSIGIVKGSEFSKYTTTYVINNNECLSNSSVAQGSISYPRSRKSKRQSINSQFIENRQPDNLTVVENIVNDQDDQLLQPCIISNYKQYASNFQNILSQSDLVNLKENEKQEFLQFLKEENEKEIEKEIMYKQMQKEAFELENNLKNEKSQQLQEQDSHKLQIWILEDKIQQINEQIDQSKNENDSHYQKVTDIQQSIQMVKSQIQNQENSIQDALLNFQLQKELHANLQKQQDTLKLELEDITKENQEEMNNLQILNQANKVKQLLFDELSIKEKELENQKIMLIQKKNNQEIENYKLKKELVKMDEDIEDSKQINERNLLEKDMFETQLSFYLKQQSIMTKDIDIFQKKKLFYSDFIHYGHKNNKSLFQIIQDYFNIIQNFKDQKLNLEKDIQQFSQDNINLNFQISQKELKIISLDQNFNQLSDLKKSKNNIFVDQIQNKSQNEKNSAQKIKQEVNDTNIGKQKINSGKKNDFQQVNSIKNTVTIQNSRQQSTCHTRSQTVCEDELKTFYENIKRNQINQIQYDQPITSRQSLQRIKHNQHTKSQSITIQKQDFNPNQYQLIINENKINQNYDLYNRKQKIEPVAELSNKSPFDLNNFFVSKNSLISQDSRSNNFKHTRISQSFAPNNHQNQQKNKFNNNQQFNIKSTIVEQRKSNPSQYQQDQKNNNQLNLNSINPLRKNQKIFYNNKLLSKSNDFEKQNSKNIKKMNLGKQLNRYLEEIEHENYKSRQQYNQICLSVKNIIKKSDRNQIIDKKSKRTNKSSECSNANGSKCSTFRQNKNSDKKFEQKNDNSNKFQIEKKSRCFTRFVQSKNLLIPDETINKQKLKQFIKNDMPKQNEDLEQTLKQKSYSQSLSSTKLFDSSQIRNSYPFKRKQTTNLSIDQKNYQYSNKISIEKAGEIKNELQQQMFKSKTAQRLIQEYQFISKRTIDNQNNYNNNEKMNTLYKINEKNAFPFRRSLSNNQNVEIKQRYLSDQQKLNPINSYINQNIPIQPTDNRIRYSKFIQPLRTNANLAHTLCSQSHMLTPTDNLKFNSEIDCLSNQIHQNSHIQNLIKFNLNSPEIKYQLFKKSISSNELTAEQYKDNPFNFKNDQFEFKSKFGRKSIERKNAFIYQKQQLQENKNDHQQINNNRQQNMQDSNLNDNQLQMQKQNVLNQNGNQIDLKLSKYLMQNLNQSSILCQDKENYFNVPQKSKIQTIGIVNQLSSSQYKTVQANHASVKIQDQVMNVIQKQFTNQGQLSLKSNFAKNKFEIQSDQNLQQIQIQPEQNFIKHNQILLQSQPKQNNSPGKKKKQKNSKLSQFLQPISKCEETSSRNCEQKNILYQEKMDQELKILQAQIFQEVKKQPNSPKQPKSAFIGRKKSKIQDEIQNSFQNQMELLQSQKMIPATPNDSMKKVKPLNIYDEEELRKINLVNSPQYKKQTNTQQLKEDKENISPVKSIGKNKIGLQNIVFQEKIQNLEYKELKDQLKADLYSDYSHISLSEQDEIISQLKSNKEIQEHF